MDGTAPHDLVEPDGSGGAAGAATATGADAAAAVDAARRWLPGREGHPALDRIAALAARLLGVASAQVSLLTEVQTIAAGPGLAEGAVGSCGPVEDSLCTVTAGAARPLVVADAAGDARVNHLPPVVGGQVGAYLGVPLRSLGDDVVGALCVFDAVPRRWSDADVQLLEHLAASVQAELELMALGRDYDVARARLDLAMQAGDIGAFDWNLVTGELDWDDRLIAMYGYDAGDVAFSRHIDSVSARLHPDDADMVGQTMADAIEAVGPLQVLYRIVVPGVGIRWLEARGRALAGPDGVANRLLGVSWDVTAEQEAEARAERVLATMSVGFLAMDAAWRITYVNAEGRRLLGAGVADPVGTTIWDLFPGTVDSVFGDAYREVAATGRPRTLEAHYPEPLNAWYEVRVVATPEGVALYFLDVTARREAEQLLQLSVDVAERMVGAVDVDAAVTALARLVVPRLADWSIVTLVEPDGSTRDVESAHRDPALATVLTRYASTRLDDGGSGVVGQVVASGRPVAIDADVLEFGRKTLRSAAAVADLEVLAPESAVVVPLVAGERVAGVLTLGRGADRPAITQQELAVTLSMCRRAGLAIDNAALSAATAAAAEHDRTVAQALQQALLTHLPEADHLHLVARYLTAADGDQVGGDWYDAIVAQGGATTIMVGDVVGHDITAAASMGQLRTMLRMLALEDDAAPSTILSRLDVAARTLKVDTMASVVLARIEQTEADAERGVRRLRWSNAGHPPPILLGPDGRAAALTAERVDVLIGVSPDRARHDHTAELPAGSTLVLYTDGLIETRTVEIEQGIARLCAALEQHADAEPGAMLDAVLADIVGDQQADDVAILAVRLHPEDRPRPAEAGPEHR